MSKHIALYKSSQTHTCSNQGVYIICVGKTHRQENWGMCNSLKPGQKEDEVIQRRNGISGWVLLGLSEDLLES